jgi:multidrug efflux pump subunit AcrA (membrane-fusion protein)
VTVQVITGEHDNVLLVPREAVHVDDGQSYVYLVVGDELHRQPVQTSIFNFTQAEVRQGLSDDKTVALGSVNNRPMHDRQAVKVVQ